MFLVLSGLQFTKEKETLENLKKGNTFVISKFDKTKLWQSFNVG